MNRLCRDTVRTAVSLLLSLLLLVQGLSPAGYMPAGLDSGWLVMLCPEGLPTNFLAATDPHAGHHQHSSDSNDHHNSRTDYCQLGSTLDTPAVAISADAVADRLPLPDYHQTSYATPMLRPRVLQSRPRAPPTA